MSWMHIEARDGALYSTLYLTFLTEVERHKERKRERENTGDLLLHNTLLTRQGLNELIGEGGGWMNRWMHG